MASKRRVKAISEEKTRDEHQREVIEAFRELGWTAKPHANAPWITVVMPGEIEPWHALRAEIKTFAVPSKYGIKRGRISKLAVSWGDQSLYGYERGQDFDCLDEHPDGRMFYESILGVAN